MAIRFSLRLTVAAGLIAGALMLSPSGGTAHADDGNSTDLTRTLTEAFAESAAILYYYQQQVANEAYLDTG